MIIMVKRGRYFWKMIESPAPDTDLEIDSLDVLGENPSVGRSFGEINGETKHMSKQNSEPSKTDGLLTSRYFSITWKFFVI